MTTAGIRSEVAGKVLVALAAADRSKKWLSIKTGIPYSTLDRKLRAQAEFNFADLAEIAQALEVKPSDFTPTVFARSPQSMRAAA